MVDQSDPIECWAEEDGVRIKFERWGDGMKVTIWELGAQAEAKTASLADYRWERVVTWATAKGAS
jgi:hypothetical protein